MSDYESHTLTALLSNEYMIYKIIYLNIKQYLFSVKYLCRISIIIVYEF